MTHKGKATMIIVVSDIHLGYNKCDKDPFYEFIDVKFHKLNKVTVEYEKDRSVGDARLWTCSSNRDCSLCI
jgi:hypothetical protein